MSEELRRMNLPARMAQLEEYRRVVSGPVPVRPVQRAPDPMIQEAARRAAVCAACTDKACAIRRMRSCKRRGLLARPGMACTADPPKWGPFALHCSAVATQCGAEPAPPPRRLKVVWTISAWNEGDWPRVTVDDLVRSVAGAGIDFQVILTDDASTDGFCKGLQCRVETNKTPQGIGANLNAAAAIAIGQMGADVVGVADAHMLHPKGCIEAVAVKASSEICIATAASAVMSASAPPRMYGAHLVSDLPTQPIAAAWTSTKAPKETWGRVQAPLGACYAMSSETIKALSAPTGRLWETVVGRWGFLVEPVAIKAALLDIPVYVARDHYTRHLYKRLNRNPVPDAWQGKIDNTLFATAGLFHQDAWERYFRPWFLLHGTRRRLEDVEALAARAREGVTLPWTAEREIAFLESLPTKTAGQARLAGPPITTPAAPLDHRRDEEIPLSV